MVFDLSKKKEMINSPDFWKKYVDKMPNLSKLFYILANIPAASAQIERFFSMTGLVCDKRRLRMKTNLIVIRSMLLANISILQNLNSFGE